MTRETAVVSQLHPPFDEQAAEPLPGWPAELLYRYAAAQLALNTAKGLWRAGRALLLTREAATDDEIWLAAAAVYVRRPMPLVVMALMLARRPCPTSDETTAAVCLGLLYGSDPTLTPKRRAAARTGGRATKKPLGVPPGVQSG